MHAHANAYVACIQQTHMRAGTHSKTHTYAHAYIHYGTAIRMQAHTFNTLSIAFFNQFNYTTVGLIIIINILLPRRTTFEAGPRFELKNKCLYYMSPPCTLSL